MRMKKKTSKTPPAYRKKPYIFRMICSLFPAFKKEDSWDEFFLNIRNKLFDHIGEIEDFEEGFCCVPENTAGISMMIIDYSGRTVCFQIVGFQNEREVMNIINSGIENFGLQFKTSVSPKRYECWTYHMDKPPTLVEAHELSEEDQVESKTFRYTIDKIGNA